MNLLQPYEFVRHDGWPPNDMAGANIVGFDSTGNPCVLRWIPTLKPTGQWHGVKFDLSQHGDFIPLAFTRGSDTEHHVVKWAEMPVTYAELEEIGKKST